MHKSGLQAGLFKPRYMFPEGHEKKQCCCLSLLSSLPGAHFYMDPSFSPWTIFLGMINPAMKANKQFSSALPLV